MKSNLNVRFGFTLVELVVVVFVVSLLLMISALSYDKVQDATLSTKTKENAAQAKTALEVYNSEKSGFPGMIQEIYKGGKLTKITSGNLSIIPDAHTSPLNGSIGLNTLVYACMSSCTGGVVRGARLGYWDFNTSSTQYTYLGEANSSSSWDFPPKLISMSSGGTGSCGISDSNLAYCWGGGGYGQIGVASGNGDTLSSVPVAVDASGILMNKDIIEVTNFSSAACALSSNGKVYCWGNGASGELGNGQFKKYETPQAVYMDGALSGKTVKTIEAGGGHICAIASDDKAYCWGNNSVGRLGNNNTTNQSAPVAVDTSGVLSGKTILAVSAGLYHSCLIASDNKAYCFGYDFNGQLGDGTQNNSSVAVAVNTSGVLAGKNMSQISSGSSHTCALDNTGKAYCWGLNSSGQLGNNSTLQSTTPVSVDTTGVLAGKTLISISAGSTHTCAVDNAGKAYCWGNGNFGKLGVTFAGNSLTPIAVDMDYELYGKSIVKVSVATYISCFLTTENKTYCAGTNTQGNMGSTYVNIGYMYASPTIVDTSNLPSGAGFTSINTYSFSSCGVGTNKRVYCWGSNTEGQLGNGISPDRLSPTKINLGALAGKTVKSIKNGWTTSCALDSNDKIYCWGRNGSGEVGNGSSNLTEYVPVAIGETGLLSGKTILDYSIGSQTTCVIASDNLPYCWGVNTNGQFGNGTTVSNSTPTAVTMTGVLSGKTAKSISVGSSSVCIVASDNLPYCWGSNTYGELGDNTGIQKTLPVAVDMTGALSGKTVKSISVNGGSAPCVIASDDKVYCWGTGLNGTVGSNDFFQHNAPVAVYTGGDFGGKNVKQIINGYAHTCALTTSNEIFCWGFGAYGQLGINDTASVAAPVRVKTNEYMPGRTISSLTAGKYFTCATTTSNEIFCWGENNNGQFGNGSSDSSLIPTPGYM